MEGGVEGVELCGVEVSGVGKGGLAHGADEREGGVEHDGGFGRLVDVLVGVADGDGAYGCGGAAAHADDGQGQKGEEAQKGDDETCRGIFGIVFAGAVGVAVEVDERQDEDNAYEDKIPVVEEFDAEDAAEVAFVLEFGEEGPRGAAACVAGIDRVDKVDDKHEGIDHDEEYLECQLVAFGSGPAARQRHEDEENVEQVGVEDGGGVEPQTARYEAAKRQLAPAGGVEVPELHHIHHTAEHVEQIDEQQVVEQAEKFHGEGFKIGNR